ncbi:hypothetical protein U8527_06070 [Kordia algicida OT-1]
MNKNSETAECLVIPSILTLYSAFECFLTNIESQIINNDNFKNKYSNSYPERPKMIDRPFVFYNILNDENFDKTSKLYDDYNHFIKLRNLITHSRLELFEWKDLESKKDIKVSINTSHIEKKEMRKLSKTTKILRDKDADKIISFLERRKLIDIQAQFRMEGFVYTIQKVKIANWANDMITNLMLKFGEDRSNPFYNL